MSMLIIIETKCLLVSLLNVYAGNENHFKVPATFYFKVPATFCTCHYLFLDNYRPIAWCHVQCPAHTASLPNVLLNLSI